MSRSRTWWCLGCHGRWHALAGGCVGVVDLCAVSEGLAGEVVGGVVLVVSELAICIRARRLVAVAS